MHCILNFKFSLWVEQEISHFINSNLSFFDRNDVENYEDNDEVYEVDFRKKFNAFIKGIRDNIGRIISILAYFFDI